MRAIVLAVGAAAVFSAGTALAQYPDYRYDDHDWQARHRGYDDWRAQHRDDERWREERRWEPTWECWNPHAGHFESVRGGPQHDLDFSRCRPINGDAPVQPYPGYDSGYYGWR